MTTADPFGDLVITFKPEATPEEQDRFLTELAHAIIEVARHLVTQQAQDACEDGEMETIDF